MAQTKEGALKRKANTAHLTVDEYVSLVQSGTKRCTKCKTWKSISEFGNDKTRPDGKDATCFICRRVKERKSTKGRVSIFKGHKHTDEAKQKMSAAKKGKPGTRKGIRHTDETRKKISLATRERTPRGDKCWNFSHGRAIRFFDDRRKPEYRYWRKAVFERDHYICQDCSDNGGGNLRAHHIKPFAKNPELRFDVSNGITLCHHCHELRHFKPDSIRNQRKLKRGERLWK